MDKKVGFPHANNFEMDAKEFLVAWAAWFSGPTSRGLLPADGPVPRLNGAIGLAGLQAQGRGHGLDALCRNVVPSQYQDTMHATNPWMTENTWLVEKVCTKNPTTGQRVNGARLTACGQKILADVRRPTAGGRR